MENDDGSEIGIEFGANLADGAYWPRMLTGRELAEMLFGTDVRPPIRSVLLKAKTDDGKIVRLRFSKDDTDTVHAEIE